MTGFIFFLIYWYIWQRNYKFVFTILLFKMDQNNENGILFKLTIKQSIAWLKFKFFALKWQYTGKFICSSTCIRHEKENHR